MLYLIKSAGYNENDNNIDLLKVGFTNDIKARYNQYLSSNPTCKLLGEREGDLSLESIFHYYFHEKNYEFYIGNEWYNYYDDIISTFNNISEEDLYREITITDLVKITHNPSNFDNLVEKWFSYNTVSKKDKNTFDYLMICKENSLFEKRLEKITERIEEDQTFLDIIPEPYRKYFLNLSLEDIKNSGYKKLGLDMKLNRIINTELSKSNNDLVNDIYTTFIEGESYSSKYIKTTLLSLYGKHGISLKAKSTDLDKYFYIFSVKILNSSTGKRDSGYKIINKK